MFREHSGAKSEQRLKVLKVLNSTYVLMSDTSNDVQKNLAARLDIDRKDLQSDLQQQTTLWSETLEDNDTERHYRSIIQPIVSGITQPIETSILTQIPTGTTPSLSRLEMSPIEGAVNASILAASNHNPNIPEDVDSTFFGLHEVNETEKNKSFDVSILDPLWRHSEDDKPARGIKSQTDYMLSLVNDPVFGFWINWYSGFMEGRPPRLSFLKDIAFIDPYIWESGAKAVAAEIERIQAKHFAAQNPLAETVAVNPDTQRFYTTPIPVRNQPLISALLSSVRDSVEDATLSNNGLNATSREVRVLNRTIDCYANDPQRIEMDFTSVAVGLRRQIHDTKELPNSEDNLALLEAVEDGVRGLRAAHSDVAENRRLLAEQKLKELSRDDIALLEDARPLLVAISEGQMAEDFAQDIPELINDALTPLPSGAPPLPGADASTRVFNRVSKMRLLKDEVSAKGASIFDSKEFKQYGLG